MSVGRTISGGLRNYGGELRNGFRPRRVQTAEGELSVATRQVREAAEPFVSRLFPRGTKLLRTEPLPAMVIGGRAARRLRPAGLRQRSRGPVRFVLIQPPPAGAEMTDAVSAARARVTRPRHFDRENDAAA
jgi:hypothetical protein